MIRIKRVYREPSPEDGVRVLIDRMWPRGISTERAHIVEWRKNVAPSTSLRNSSDTNPPDGPSFAGDIERS